MSSILNDVKQMCGLNTEYDDPHFDPQLIIHINTTLSILNQLGVGKYGFFIEDDGAEWEDFINSEQADLNLQDIKTYVGLKVRMMFDPPSSSAHIQSLDNIIKELEWRMNIERDRSIINT